MTDKYTLFPTVKDYIHFDLIYEQVEDDISTYSGQYWTDNADHDPGITLLQALCYNVSDLAYRTSLPITDLLTPDESLQQEGIFPADFGPQLALTCGPVTADDYRRAILDLHSTDNLDQNDPEQENEGYFLFQNVQLIREPESERYRYWIDPETRNFLFKEPAKTTSKEGENDEDEEDIKSITLQGNYYLYLEPTRQTLANKEKAQQLLEIFLHNHRNIGESVREIFWLTPQQLDIKMEIELEDDWQDIPAVLANIYTETEDYIRPLATRYTALQLVDQGMVNETIYQGPQLQHGWITELPSAIDCQQPITVNISLLTNRLLAIQGIKHIRYLGIDDKDSWNWTAKQGSFPLLWGEKPLEVLAAGKMVKLIKYGQEYTSSADDINALLPLIPLITEQPVIMEYGRFREPAHYYPASDKLPACYELQNFQPSTQQQQLYQFLLPFEQILANGCQQLALLPSLLAFVRQGNNVWGGQWPFAEDSIANQIHKDYQQQIQQALTKNSKDQDKELELIDYLLGYFGTSRAPNILSKSDTEFLTVQQNYLSYQTNLVYQRANIRIDQVSALQQRIAARLGIGAELFDPKVNLNELTFYVLENRALLPAIPDSSYDELQAVEQLERLQINAAEDFLILTVAIKSTAPLYVGQLIDLVLTEQENYRLKTLMIQKIDNNRIYLSISENEQLQRNIKRIETSFAAGGLYWQNSQVWLNDMTYLLSYAADQTGITAKQKRLTAIPQSPYPIRLAVGDKIIIGNDIGPDFEPIISQKKDMVNRRQFSATVVSIDPVNGLYVIESEEEFPAANVAHTYHWYQDTPVTDRFSFVVSVIFRQSLLEKVTDPYATEAWIRQIISLELPAHIRVQLYWFNDLQFDSFALTYQRWQNSGAPLGDYAYQLLFQLSLGIKPQLERGISLMRIATEDEQLQVIGETGEEWNVDVITENELFYVPPETN